MIRLHEMLVRPALRAVMRFGWAPTSLAAGVAATVAVALSMSGTLASWNATIKHNDNNASSGTLVMQEVYGGVTCNSTDSTNVNTNQATCVGINHYGGNTLVPGAVSPVITVSVKNTGTIAASRLTLTFAPCTQSNNTATGNSAGSATNLCDVMFLYAQAGIGGTTTPMTSTSISLTAANTGGPYNFPAVPAGATATLYFQVGLAGGLGNDYQGLTATQPITFQFSA